MSRIAFIQDSSSKTDNSYIYYQNSLAVYNECLLKNPDDIAIQNNNTLNSNEDKQRHV